MIDQHDLRMGPDLAVPAPVVFGFETQNAHYKLELEEKAKRDVLTLRCAAFTHRRSSRLGLLFPPVQTYSILL